MQRQISVPARWRDTSAIDSDHVTFRINPSTLLEDDLGVHLNATLADQNLAGATRGDASLGEDLLEAYALGGFGH
jgi:hypothetical protein